MEGRSGLHVEIHHLEQRAKEGRAEIRTRAQCGSQHLSSFDTHEQSMQNCRSCYCRSRYRSLSASLSVILTKKKSGSNGLSPAPDDKSGSAGMGGGTEADDPHPK